MNETLNFALSRYSVGVCVFNAPVKVQQALKVTNFPAICSKVLRRSVEVV